MQCSQPENATQQPLLSRINVQPTNHRQWHAQNKNIQRHVARDFHDVKYPPIDRGSYGSPVALDWIVLE